MIINKYITQKTRLLRTWYKHLGQSMTRPHAETRRTLVYLPVQYHSICYAPGKNLNRFPTRRSEMFSIQLIKTPFHRVLRWIYNFQSAKNETTNKPSSVSNI